MSISSKRSRRILALGVALAVAPVALKSSFAAESESEASAEPSGPKAVATVLVSPVPASEIATPLIRAGLTAEALSALRNPLHTGRKHPDGRRQGVAGRPEPAAKR